MFNNPLGVQRLRFDEGLIRGQVEIDVLKIDNHSSEQIATKAPVFHSGWPEMRLEDALCVP